MANALALLKPAQPDEVNDYQDDGVPENELTQSEPAQLAVGAGQSNPGNRRYSHRYETNIPAQGSRLPVAMSKKCKLSGGNFK